MYFLQMAYEVCHVSGCICVCGPARGGGGRSDVTETQKRTKCVFSLSAMRAHVTVRPLPRGHVKQSGPPVYDRLVIIHTGGVCVQ